MSSSNKNTVNAVFSDIYTTNRKYNIILADPPWTYDNTHIGTGGCGKYYSTMSLDELKELRQTILRIAANDCLLLMWVTNPMMHKGLELMQHWGFVYKTHFLTWVKTKKGTNEITRRCNGHYGTRQCTETILLGVRGSPLQFIITNDAIPNVLLASPREHSRKPDEAKQLITRIYGDIPRLEMFARASAWDGWDVWGNEVEKFNEGSADLKLWFVNNKEYSTDAIAQHRKVQDMRAKLIQAEREKIRREKKVSLHSKKNRFARQFMDETTVQKHVLEAERTQNRPVVENSYRKHQNTRTTNKSAASLKQKKMTNGSTRQQKIRQILALMNIFST